MKNLAKKIESYEICFVPDNDYPWIHQTKWMRLRGESEGGDYRHARKLFGQHEGYPFYTIGSERVGIAVAIRYM